MGVWSVVRQTELTRWRHRLPVMLPGYTNTIHRSCFLWTETPSAPGVWTELLVFWMSNLLFRCTTILWTMSWYPIKCSKVVSYMVTIHRAERFTRRRKHRLPHIWRTSCPSQDELDYQWPTDFYFNGGNVRRERLGKSNRKR
jgi:hypothetical protein